MELPVPGFYSFQRVCDDVHVDSFIVKIFSNFAYVVLPEVLVYASHRQFLRSNTMITWRSFDMQSVCVIAIKTHQPAARPWQQATARHYAACEQSRP